MATVDIIIPTYNSSQYLPVAIQSCLDQTYKDIQIVVVDDGSTDNTRQVVAEYPVTYIYQSNQGPSAARNRGWRASQSEYLQFLDADDVLLPQKIEHCLQAFTPDIDVVYTNYEYRSADLRRIVPNEPTVRPEGNIYEILLNSIISLFPPHAPLIRRAAADQTAKFNEQLKGTEDWYFWIELAGCGTKFKYLDEILVTYRLTPDSLSTNRLLMAQNRLAAVEEFRRLPLPPTFNLNHALGERHHVLAMNYWHLGNKAEARKHFRMGLGLSDQSKQAKRFLIFLSYLTNSRRAESILNYSLRITGKKSHKRVDLISGQ
jgi:glycosyltransferase involved in cell wall biosynthesis